MKKILCSIVAVFAMVAVAAAQDDKTGDKGKEAGSEINIVSDSMFTAPDKKFAEFKGNVRAEQGDTVIRADSLKIFFNHRDKNGKDSKAGDVQRITAEGNVSMNFRDMTATCDKAVYSTATKRLVLTGENPRIVRGGNFFSGARIVLDRATGRVTCESGPGQRVKAKFYGNRMQWRN